MRTSAQADRYRLVTSMHGEDKEQMDTLKRMITNVNNLDIMSL